MLGFERGPVALLMDTHTNFTSPDTCENGKFDYMEVLSMLWVDDAALAEALRALGIQAGVMEIDFQSDNGTPLHQRWTVETEAGISEIEVVAPTYSSNVGSPLILRVVSWNGNRLSLLDFGYGPAETPIVDGNLAMGTLSKGFLMSGTTDRDFVARADVYIRQTASVSVSQFNDSLCTDPVIGP